jgi:hypothetical protein
MNIAPLDNPSLLADTSAAMSQSVNDTLPLDDPEDPPLSSNPRLPTDSSTVCNLGAANDDSMNYDETGNSDPPPPMRRSFYGPLTHYQPPATTFLCQPPPINQLLVSPLLPRTTRVQGQDTENVLTNLDPSQIRLWNETADPKILVYTWEPSYSPRQYDLVQALRKAIASTITIPKPDVSPPQAAHLP